MCLAIWCCRLASAPMHAITTASPGGCVDARGQYGALPSVSAQRGAHVAAASAGDRGHVVAGSAAIAASGDRLGAIDGRWCLPGRGLPGGRQRVCEIGERAGALLGAGAGRAGADIRADITTALPSVAGRRGSTALPRVAWWCAASLANEETDAGWIGRRLRAPH